ncbi:MAG: DNA-formamidopyrimidine glycosylase family protein [Nocardioidaceae bacterium]
MPEGHTLFRLAADISAAFGGQHVEVSSPQGRFSDSAALVDGDVLESAESAGKHLFIRFEGGHTIHVHLGLIGVFNIEEGEPPPAVGAVRLRIVGAAAYADLRGATTCELIGDDERALILAKLGPDPLRPDADPGKAFTTIHKSSKPIGALLMDQSVLAGVGNVYRAESLFRARLHPLTPGSKVAKGRWDAIWADLVDLMDYGVQTGRIDTVRREHEPEAMGREPRVDDHGGEVYVYRRQDQTCFVCGSRVQTKVLEGRNLFWCPTCQRRH